MMENRRLIIAMLLGLAAILLYQGLFVPWLDKKKGWDKLQNAESQPAATQPESQPTSVASSQPPAAAVATAPTTAPATSIATGTGAAHIVPASASPSSAVSLGSATKFDGEYALQLNLQPTAAAASSVVLNDYKISARSDELYTFEQPLSQRSDISAFASRNITVDGQSYDLAGVQWSLISSTRTQAVYGANLVRGDQPVLEIRKSFTISPRSSDNKGFEVRLETSFNNLTDQPMTVQSESIGPVVPPAETYRSPDRQVVAGYAEGNSIKFEQHPIEEFHADKDSGNIDLTSKDSKPRAARWIGAASNYFGAIVLPENSDDITSVIAHGVNVEKDTPMDDHDAYLSMQTRQIRIEPHKSASVLLSVFFGPKWREVLEQPHYTNFPRAYNLMLVISSGICGFCTFAPLVNAIIWLLKIMEVALRDWGLAIIGLVAIVRVILHPITRHSQISMSKMSKMGPEMKRLQEKYKDDKEALNKAMVDFHKQQGLGPYLGCLPMFLQMPIWIALYGVLQTTFELRQAPFLWNLTWIHDLSKPDYLIQFGRPLFEMVSFLPTIRGLNVVPILLAVVMVIQQQFMPKPVAATPEQIQQQKMMMYMSPIMFLVFFYNLPSGLNLYIFTSTAVGIIESKVVRDHIRKREEAEKAGKVFVETKPTRASRSGKPVSTKEEPVGCVGRIFMFWTKLQEQAEQARKEQKRKDDRGS